MNTTGDTGRQALLPGAISELTLLIAERAAELARGREIPPGGELALWLEAEWQVKHDARKAPK